jgi:streptogramin lyase
MFSPDLQQQVNNFWCEEIEPQLADVLTPQPTVTRTPTRTRVPSLTPGPSRTPITAAPTRTITARVSATPGFVSSTISVGGSFKDVRSIGVDGTGRAVVSEYQDGRIMSLNALATITNTWTVPDSSLPVTGMAVDRNGIIYVAQSSELTRYDSTGKALSKVNYARGFRDVATLPDGGFVASWYSANLNDDVLVFDAGDVLRLTINKALSGVKGSADLTMRVATDQQGNVYVWSALSDMIVKYAPDGTRAATIGSRGSQDGQFLLLNCVAVDSKGRVFASDSKGIQVFDADGKFIDKFTLSRGTPYDMVFSDQNELWIAARTTVMKLGISK